MAKIIKANKSIIKEIGKVEAAKLEAAHLSLDTHRVYHYAGGDFFGDEWHITLLRYMASGSYKPEAYDSYINIKYGIARNTLNKQRNIFKRIHEKIGNSFPKWASKTERDKELAAGRGLKRRIDRSPIAKNLVLHKDEVYEERDDFKTEETLDEYIARDARSPGVKEWKMGTLKGPKPQKLKEYVKANIKVVKK